MLTSTERLPVFDTQVTAKKKTSTKSAPILDALEANVRGKLASLGIAEVPKPSNESENFPRGNDQEIEKDLGLDLMD